MESTFLMLLEIEPLWDRYKKAESKGTFSGLSFEEHIQDALLQGFINTQEAEQLTCYNAKRFDSMLTDVFDMKLDQVLPLHNPHLKQNQSELDQEMHSETNPNAQDNKQEPEAFLRF